MAIHKILFPTDLSDSAENALYYVINFAEILGAEIHIVHFWNTDDGSLLSEDLEEEEVSIKVNNQKKLSALIYKGKQLNPSLSFDSIVRYGNLNNINDVSLEYSIDLIMMGTSGAGALKAFLEGTNAARIIRQSSCPVYIIPEYSPYVPIRKILFCSDYYDSDIDALSYLTSIARPFDASITVLNIAHEKMLTQGIVKNEFENEIRDKISYKKIGHLSIEAKDIYEQIIRYAEKEGTDLLVMSTNHRSKFERLFDSSLTEKMAYNTSVPLLAFHVKESKYNLF